MKTRKSFFIFVVLFLMVARCSNEIANEEQRIEVQKRIDDENDYKVIFGTYRIYSWIKEKKM
ncbi:hypothetical protein WAX74_19980 [Psychrobacillus sp. FJAT-51614]|uniref:Lipoprotein n=1 Tax=Psychrobacillus mangrovi TaxID=3117745 RepID=A0ABU8FA53_9BACI